MFIDSHKETEIKLESYRLKLWYYHDVMTSFFSFRCFKSLEMMIFDELMENNEIKTLKMK